MHNKKAIFLMIVGGICMIVSSAVGSLGVFEFLYGLALTYVHPALIPLIDVVITVFRWIADLGGIAVIAGALLIAVSQIRLGKFIIWIGLTFGTLALIVWIIAQIVNITGIITDPQILAILATFYSYFNYNTGLAFVGVTIAIIGRWIVKKPPKVKKTEEALIPPQEISSVPSGEKFCPNCGKPLPAHANFCSECGASF
jgi:hypothetical protein